MLKTRWETIRDDVAGMLADGVPLEDITGKLEKLKNEYQKPLTNEEWFTSLSTEEKAEWMAKHMSFCEVCEIQSCRGDSCQRFDRGNMTETDAFREWLKEKHDA